MDAARRVRWAGLLCVAILALGVSLAAAAPGDLDSSFNGTGTRSFHYGAGPNDTAVTALIQPGGKIVLSGDGQQPSNTEQDAVVGRLNLNGSTASTFGSGGTGATSLDFGDPFSDGAAAFAPDGKIVVTGEIAPRRHGHHRRGAHQRRRYPGHVMGTRRHRIPTDRPTPLRRARSQEELLTHNPPPGVTAAPAALS